MVSIGLPRSLLKTCLGGAIIATTRNGILFLLQHYKELMWGEQNYILAFCIVTFSRQRRNKILRFFSSLIYYSTSIHPRCTALPDDTSQSCFTIYVINKCVFKSALCVKDQTSFVSQALSSQHWKTAASHEITQLKNPVACTTKPTGIMWKVLGPSEYIKLCNTSTLNACYASEDSVSSCFLHLEGENRSAYVHQLY